VVGAALAGLPLFDAVMAASAHPAGVLIILVMPAFAMTRRWARMD
jgi:hypothetical protein